MKNLFTKNTFSSLSENTAGLTGLAVTLSIIVSCLLTAIAQGSSFFYSSHYKASGAVHYLYCLCWYYYLSENFRTAVGKLYRVHDYSHRMFSAVRLCPFIRTL